MTITGNDFLVRANAFCLIAEKRASSTQMSPAGTLCFDIFSPPPGDNDVISQVERLSSNEMKIAPRSLRIALGASGRSATVCMVVSRVGDRNLTLPERRSLSTSPWDLDNLLVLRHRWCPHKTPRPGSSQPWPAPRPPRLSLRPYDTKCRIKYQLVQVKIGR